MRRNDHWDTTLHHPAPATTHAAAETGTSYTRRLRWSRDAPREHTGTRVPANLGEMSGDRAHSEDAFTQPETEQEVSPRICEERANHECRDLWMLGPRNPRPDLIVTSRLPDLHQLADWFKQCAIETVARSRPGSTGARSTRSSRSVVLTSTCSTRRMSNTCRGAPRAMCSIAGSPAHRSLYSLPPPSMHSKAHSRTAPVLLDVRTGAEFDVSHLPGARRVDPDADAAKVGLLVAQGRPS